MKGITALFLIIAIALGIYIFDGRQKSMTEMIQDEIQTGAAAPIRSEQPL